jgi:hypothetical protein
VSIKNRTKETTKETTNRTTKRDDKMRREYVQYTGRLPYFLFLTQFLFFLEKESPIGYTVKCLRRSLIRGIHAKNY